MLGKLFKHEFIYGVKSFAPMYIGFAAVSILLRIVMEWGDSAENDRALESTYIIFTTTLFIAFVVLIVAMLGRAIFGNIRRFHANLFTDEGYLMHTLPVPSWQHIICKLLTGMAWYAISCVIAVLGVMLAAGGKVEFFPYGVFTEFSDIDTLQIVQFFASITAYCAFILLCYLGEAFISMMGQKKGLATLLVIGALIINSFVLSFLTVIFLTSDDNHENIYLGMYVIRLVYYTVVSAGLFFLTNLIISKKLNLQ